MPSSDQSRLLYDYLLKPQCYVGVTQFTRRLLQEGRPVSKKSEVFPRKKDWKTGYRPDKIPYWTWMHLRARMNALPGCNLPQRLKPSTRAAAKQARSPAAGAEDAALREMMALDPHNLNAWNNYFDRWHPQKRAGNSLNNLNNRGGKRQQVNAGQPPVMRATRKRARNNNNTFRTNRQVRNNADPSNRSGQRSLSNDINAILANRAHNNGRPTNFEALFREHPELVRKVARM